MKALLELQLMACNPYHRLMEFSLIKIKSYLLVYQKLPYHSAQTQYQLHPCTLQPYHHLTSVLRYLILQKQDALLGIRMSRACKSHHT